MIESLKKFSKKDEVAKKYKSEVERVNEDLAFQDYMSYEEEQGKIQNTLLDRTKEEVEKLGEKRKAIEIAKNLIYSGVDEEIVLKSACLTKGDLNSDL